MSGVTQPPPYRGTKNNADVITRVLAATEKGKNAKITENRAKRDSRHVYCTFWPKYTFFCIIFQNKEGRVSGYVWGGVCWSVCGGVWGRVWGVLRRVWRGGGGHGLEKVSLAALLSGYLGKSGHLPRYF